MSMHNSHRQFTSGVEDFSAYERKEGQRKEFDDFVSQSKAQIGSNISLIVNNEERHQRAKDIRTRNLTGV